MEKTCKVGGERVRKKKNNEKPVKMCLDTKLRRALEKDQFNIIFSGADNSPFIWCSVYFPNNDF